MPPWNLSLTGCALIPRVVFSHQTKLICKNWCTKLLCRNWWHKARFFPLPTNFFISQWVLFLASWYVYYWKLRCFFNDCYSFLLSRITQQSPNCSTWPRAWAWSVARCCKSCFFTELKSKSKIFHASCGDYFTTLAALAQQAPPISQHLPTPLYTSVVPLFRDGGNTLSLLESTNC